MKKFEYKIILRDGSLTTGDLNNYGKNGWELISYFMGSIHTYHFKRELK